MQREMIATLAGEEITLAATFKAASEIATKIADPMMITREIAVASMMEASGVTGYEPKWLYTIHNVPQILHVGMRAAGDKRTLEQVQELAFAAGFYAARDVATGYLTLIVAPQSQEEMPGDPTPGE